MSTIVPSTSGPVLHKLEYGFFDDRKLDRFPYDWEIHSLILQTEKYLQVALAEELEEPVQSVKAVHVSWEYHKEEEKPFSLTFVLHAKGASEWIPQDEIMYCMDKLDMKAYITDYIWNAECPEGKEHEFVGVNGITLESAQNREVPDGYLPDGVGKEGLQPADDKRAKPKEKPTAAAPEPEQPTPAPEPEPEAPTPPAAAASEPETTSEPEESTPENAPDMADGKPMFDDIYELDKQLGRGAFSIVKLGHHRETRDQYAIKMIIKAEMQEFDKKCLASEISVLQKLPDHDHIIKLYDVFDESDYIHLVLEKVDGGELLDRLIQKTQYTECEARDTLRIVFDAVGHIHKHKIAHRDLKPENLLLTSATDDSSLKIADFGFAKECPGPESLTTQCGSAQHVGPEILNNVPYGTPIDLWALGVIMFTLIGGIPPFYDTTNQKTFQKILKCDYAFDDQYWGHISEDCKDVIRNLIVMEPGKRWTTEDCLRCKWMRSDDSILSQTSLRPNQLRLTEFCAKQKLKAAIFAVIGMNRLADIAESEEE